MKVKIKKLHENAIIPAYATPGDAGLDLVSVNAKWNSNYNFHEYGTGLSVEIPEGFVGLIFPRSSISKSTYALCNSVGVIDSSFRGEIKLRFYVKDDLDDKTEKTQYNIGDKIGQMIIIPYPQVEFEEVDSLSDSVRGSGGFGSSGT